ncbi:Hypothetical protein GLP15_3786 [Giardia lamblia P15]|uniref:Ankyrin repeat protein 1 n=1 Tax=Giardia intestinalis (strain P15) TaxID=658858 RepID=E1F237_GIAIA|nr:Hypothetical protein GLP15_3786 [Giardia lamblia P15]
MSTGRVSTDEAWFNSARDGNVQTLKYMGSRLRTRDNEGRTALMLYVGNGYSKDLSFFAPEVGLVDNQGFPALKYAVDSRNTTAISYLKDELDISIPCGKTLVTCETYLRQRFTGKSSPYERKHGQEISLMSESALELTRRSAAGCTDGSPTKLKTPQIFPEAVELDGLQTVEPTNPKLAFYVQLARQRTDIVNAILLNKPFYDALDEFSSKQLESMLATNADLRPKMGLSPIQRFKQAYLPLYERYVALQNIVPPDLYAQFTNSFKAHIRTNYNLFIAIFESRSLATVGTSSPYRTTPLSPARLTPLHSQRDYLHLNSSDVMPLNTYPVLSETGTCHNTNTYPPQEAKDSVLTKALIERVLPEIGNQLLGELLDCLNSTFTKDLTFVRDDSVFIQQLSKVKMIESSDSQDSLELRVCQQKLRFYKSLYSKLTTMYSAILGHPVLPLFIVNCSILHASVDRLSCTPTVKEFLRNLTSRIASTLQSSGVYTSQTEVYDEPLVDPLYRPKMDALAAQIKREEMRVSKLIDILINLESLISEYVHLRSFMEKLRGQDGWANDAGREMYESIDARSQELRTIISTFWYEKTLT